MSYFYEEHRAIHCWATLNLYLQKRGAFKELKSNVKAKEILLWAEVDKSVHTTQTPSKLVVIFVFINSPKKEVLLKQLK
ncbi:hypothetical protein [Legionella clemsonensis]|uniref:hypothetical protein n=1 Tax=Legionella clemsonensis TaxID=1867846 RepID=UPI000B8C86E9|nr:hypothetical protein [Legionella clemsonensis]